MRPVRGGLLGLLFGVVGGLALALIMRQDNSQPQPASGAAKDAATDAPLLEPISLPEFMPSVPNAQVPVPTTVAPEANATQPARETTQEPEPAAPAMEALDTTFARDKAGFVLVPGAFADGKRSGTVRGSHRKTGGEQDGLLRLRLNRRSWGTSVNISAGWRRRFTLTRPARIGVRLRYKLTLGRGADRDEFALALATVDGQRLQAGRFKHLAQLVGEKGGFALKSRRSTGWQEYVTVLELDAGEHTLTIGAFCNKISGRREEVEMLIDRVAIREADPGLAPTPFSAQEHMNDRPGPEMVF